MPHRSGYSSRAYLVPGVRQSDKNTINRLSVLPICLYQGIRKLLKQGTYYNSNRNPRWATKIIMFAVCISRLGPDYHHVFPRNICTYNKTLILLLTLSSCSLTPLAFELQRGENRKQRWNVTVTASATAWLGGYKFVVRITMQQGVARHGRSTARLVLLRAHATYLQTVDKTKPVLYIGNISGVPQDLVYCNTVKAVLLCQTQKQLPETWNK